MKTLILIGLLISVVHLVLRIITMILGPKDILFCSPGLGRIKVRRRNGRNIGFLAHLKGLTGELPVEGGSVDYCGPVHMDEKTGEVLPGEESIWSFWWTLYGVRYIGLDDIHQYEIEKVTVNPDGTVTRAMVLAKSLHFSDVYPFVINDQETSDGVRGDLAYTITLQTTNAAETLKYKNWIRKVNPSVEGTSKDFVLGNTLKEMLAIKNELSADPDSFVRAMKSLNDDSIGNISLHKQVGQRITAANLTAVGFEDEVAKALEAQQVAERQGDARVSAAKKDADTKVEEARGMDAITLALDRRAAALAKPGGNLVASIENTKAIAEATKEHEGTVVWGGQVLPTTPV